MKNGKGYVKGFSDVFCQYDEINKYIPLILKFEGGYLNRVRNGKGKEYIFSKLKFEGEYLNWEIVLLFIIDLFLLYQIFLWLMVDD